MASILIETFGFQDVGRDFPNTCTVLAAVNQRHIQPRSQGSLLLKGALILSGTFCEGLHDALPPAGNRGVSFRQEKMR